MKKILVLVAILAGLSNAFGANCSNEHIERLKARFAELAMLSFVFGEQLSIYNLVDITEELIDNRYSAYYDKDCIGLAYNQRMKCAGRKVGEKYVKEFERRGLELNLRNIENEGLKIYKEKMACDNY